MSDVVGLDGALLDIDSTNLNSKFHVGTNIINNVDLNNITTPGMYRLQNNLTNAPNDYYWSQMLVLCAGGDTVTQIVFQVGDSDSADKRIAWRLYGFAKWNAWHYLTQTTS